MTLRINLALQGGGAHGAFSWGVLDRLLQDEGIEIAAISGTSAGALNGAALKAGMISGGRQGARDSLDALWTEVAGIGDFRLAPWLAPWVRMWQPFGTAWAETAQAVFPVSPQGILAQVFSPYAYGPQWQNPLEPVVRHLDFSRVCADAGPQLYVGATNVRTGKVRIFSGHDITPEALLASACLPTVFQAVEIGTEAYWDGGYSGNPALFPLYRPELPDDVVIVSINPLRREDVPQTPLDIQNRITEIGFNAAMLGELRAVNFVKRLIADGRMPRGQMKDVLIHFISDDTLMTGLDAASKLAPSPALFERLKAAGQAAADGFLTDHRARLGRQSSLDLSGLFG